ncbi:MAG TPA: hypothetical protein VMS64_00235 [Candidatus Methylomirabilis sp.]|nr:hypothetical protein [Candidatus Methylomirabilis sp.]
MRNEAMRVLALVLVLALLGVPLAAEGPRAEKVYRIAGLDLHLGTGQGGFGALLRKRLQE